MKSKPAKYGIKIWTIVDNRTNYVLDIDILDIGKTDGKRRERSVGESVVLKLCEHYFDRDYTRNCTFDNFFTSYGLMKEFYSHNITSTGTVRGNKREIPLEFLNKKKYELYETKYGFKEEVTIIGFAAKPTKVVILMSTEHHCKNIMLPMQDNAGFESPDKKYLKL